MINLKLTALAVLFSTGLFAQNFYVTANAGYAFGANQQQGWFQNYESISTNDPNTGNYDYNYSYENVPFSLGKGFSFGGSLGYMFNDHLGLDIGMNYLLGSKTEFSDYSKYTYDDEIDESTGNYTIYSRMFRVMPTLIITPGFDKLNPYVKFGAVMGFGAMYIESDYESYSIYQFGSSSYSSTAKTKYTQPMAIGFNGAIGANYELSENLSIFGELSFIGMNYTPTKSVTIESTVNGENDLPGKTTYELETKYVDSFTSDGNSINDDEPNEQTKLSFAASSIGLNFGVKINL